jgi:hypothetical protein
VISSPRIFNNSNISKKYNKESLNSTVEEYDMKEVNLQEVMNDNGPMSSDYYNQMLARPDKMRGSQ